MQFKVEARTEVKVNIYGTEYPMRMATVAEREALLKKIEDSATSSDLYRLQKDYIAQLGLPVEVIDKMEDDHFNELAKVFVNPKKN